MRRSGGMCSIVVLAATVLLAQASNLWALTLYPSYPTAVGSVAGNAATSAPGFGTGSWQQAGTSKAEVYLTPAALSFGAIKISDIASISYWTNKPTTAIVDWTLAIYTVPQTTGTWYNSRLNAEPYFTGVTTTPNSWTLWSTNDANNPLTFYDQPRSGNYGTYGDPTLAEIQAGPVAVGTTTHDYNNESILYFYLGTGSTWSSTFTGLVDGLTITLKNGDVAKVNLEPAAAPVPEPSTLFLLGVGFAGLVISRRRKTAL
jgi:hypothetical protein